MTSQSPNSSMRKSTPRAKLSETGAIALFKRNYFKPGQFWKKLHGNQFQEGLPDILWIVDGQSWYLEFKAVDGKSIPWKKMRLAQHLTMMQMKKAGAHVVYMVYSNENGLFYIVDPEGVDERFTYNLQEDEIWDLPF